MGRKPRRVKPGNEKSAIAYVRVSTDTERQELGASGQKAAIETWASKHGVTIAQWFIEEVSGAANESKRPVFAEAIAALPHHNAGLFVVAKWDRFSRDPVVAGLALRDIQSNGANAVACDGVGNGDDAAGKLLRGIVLLVGEYEREMIRARIKTALAVKKARGEMTGAPPYGFRLAADKKRLEADEREQAAIAQAKALRAKGLPLRAIPVELASQGIVGRTGKAFALSAIHKIVA